ncbi:hypothetical protein ACFV42_46445 [Streptomyces solisilvae]|uniref:hypothetical protein n=1 Tax=Streptomyces malaysiensis TaxID=92644 RepID=UPI0036C4343A
MRELTNLQWPDTPYGADKRPFGRRVHLLTGMAMQCADTGRTVEPVAAAAVFVPIHRTRQATVTPGTLHVGYRVAVAETGDDTAALLRFVDGILVQGRRHAAALAWHSYRDDLHVMQGLAAGRLPGVTGIGDAWADRTRRERGICPLIDTANDLAGAGGLVAHAAEKHGIELGGVLRTLQRPDSTQGLHNALTDGVEAPGTLVSKLAAGAITQALTVALLGGKALERLAWKEPFDLEEAVRLSAWDMLGPILNARPDASR